MSSTTAMQGGTVDAEVMLQERTDFDNADRGYLGSVAYTTITDGAGRAVWELDAYGFLGEECPETANPSLWRQSRLTARHGLYQVTEGVYQVRGFDLSNITFVEGTRGVLVIDPLLSVETAAAALALYREYRGSRPVTAVIYTHSHADHFGGARGVVGDGEDVPILAPAGFLEHAVSENVYAGTAMNRRAIYMYGAELPKSPAGHIGTGLGQTTSTGTISLIEPTRSVSESGQREEIDGVRIEFQLTPGTEAPSEMNFYLPDLRALCMAENATHNLHNVLTLRGAPVRDPRVWARYLTEAIERFSTRSEVLLASHHWPTWGTRELTEFLCQQRDLYAYLHDQTLRMLNQGHTGTEIAERMQMPPALQRAWHTHGYYGSVSHNVKAIYQRYMGWFDGNPAHLWELPPEESARKHVEYMGGVQSILPRARGAVEAGEWRWAAQVLNYVVFADPGNTAARELLAEVYDRLGHGSENGTWRNFYLQGAAELRGNKPKNTLDSASPDVLSALSLEQVFDSIAIRIDGPRAWDTRLTIDWRFTDLDTEIGLSLANGVLTQTRNHDGTPADLTVTLTKPELLRLISSQTLDGLRTDGDPQAFATLMGLLDHVDRDFDIVTP
ncbi:alkyl sulfatase dimerization domain-containing protein [Lipingzhangella sp. LS1_29]|uniref:Alkyl sulfatase dimerization domain-containing protein n=1 Tax=Lipingzhangella rawalii TaxID=2055835 RepID=A0ABU2HAK0_9ACTN|nr:alkyl sulfatase dimerization domain-containing protein [Lipingzhangella rawalii]MDS1272351.1 alkyl sulfatase dimerization domain-containing protein [Lipingzhangella rawalii]